MGRKYGTYRIHKVNLLQPPLAQTLTSVDFQHPIVPFFVSQVHIPVLTNLTHFDADRQESITSPTSAHEARLSSC